MQAGLGEVHRLAVRERAHLISLHTIEERTGGVLAVGTLIHQRAGGAGGVPLLATGHTGTAAHAYVQVDHQCELGHLLILMSLFHSFPLAGGRLGWGLNPR